jgi:uncharacterized membrane protein HdeD (DUF308 family)
MIIELYFLLVLLATAASYHAISRQGMTKSPAEEAIAAAFAILVYALLAVASGNIEVVSHGSTLTFDNGYLFIVWGALAFLNTLYLFVGPMENLADAAGKGLTGITGGRQQ